MTNRVSLLSLLSGCSLLMAVGMASARSHAGFEWVPANGAPPAIQKPQEVIIPEPVYVQPEMTHSANGTPVSGMQHIAVEPEVVAGEMDMAPVTEAASGEIELEIEVVADADMVEASEMTEAAVEADAVIEAEVIEAAVVVEEPVEVVVYEETMPQKAYALAYGFGKEMPLALALRQIVPASYAFSFDPLVNIGSRVSWQGGEAWNVVLKKALGEEKLTAVVYDDMVYVRPSTELEVMAAPMEAKVIPASAMPSDVTVETGPAYFDAAHSWSATSGQTLRSVLSAWSDKVGVQLHWNNVYDYAIVSDWSFDGDYVHAVDGILTAFEGETPKPSGRLHPNAPQGPAILVVDVLSAQ